MTSCARRIWYCSDLTTSLGSPDVYHPVKVSGEKRGTLVVPAEALDVIIGMLQHDELTVDVGYERPHSPMNRCKD